MEARLAGDADDFVILCRSQAEEAKKQMQAIMRALKLMVKEPKTRICQVPQEKLKTMFVWTGSNVGSFGTGPITQST